MQWTALAPPRHAAIGTASQMHRSAATSPLLGPSSSRTQQGAISQLHFVAAIQRPVAPFASRHDSACSLTNPQTFEDNARLPSLTGLFDCYARPSQRLVLLPVLRTSSKQKDLAPFVSCACLQTWTRRKIDRIHVEGHSGLRAVDAPVVSRLLKPLMSCKLLCLELVLVPA